MSRLCIAIIFLFNIVIENSSQFWRQFNRYPYPQRQDQHFNPNHQLNHHEFQQQNGFQNNFQLPPGVSMSKTEWVCKNPKTGDMMIIASEEDPPSTTEGNIQNQWHLANFSAVQTSTNSPETFYPQTQAPITDDSGDTNGEGIIDIRLGDKKVLKNETKQI